MIISIREAFLGKKPLRDYSRKDEWINMSGEEEDVWTKEFTVEKNIKSTQPVSAKGYAYVTSSDCKTLNPQDPTGVFELMPMNYAWNYYYLKKYDLVLGIPDCANEHADKIKEYVKRCWDTGNFEATTIDKI